MVALYLCLKIASVFTEKHSFLPKSVCNWGGGRGKPCLFIFAIHNDDFCKCPW